MEARYVLAVSAMSTILIVLFVGLTMVTALDVRQDCSGSPVLSETETLWCR